MIQKDILAVKDLISRTENELMEFLTDEQMRDVRNYAFEYATQEARIHRIPVSDERYSALCLARRSQLVDKLHTQLYQRLDRVKGKKVFSIDSLGLTFPDPSNLRHYILEGGKI